MPTPAKPSPKPRATRATTRARAAAKTPRRVKPVADLDQPQWYLNRELSWLEFNHRVLEEAIDETNPALERLKFLAIFSSNLDEFFEIRVAGLQQQAESRPHDAGPDGLTAAQTIEGIAARVRRLVSDQYKCYNEGVVPALAAAGLDLSTVDDLDARGRKWALEYFEREVFPVLTPLAVDPAHPFPQLANKSLNLVVELRVADRPGQIDGLLRDEHHSEFRLGVVQVPRILPRLIEVPAECAPPGRKVYLFLSSLISAYIGNLFPGLEVRGCYAFRVTRNSELYLDEDEADNLLEAMQEQLARRRKGDAVRLEVQRGANPAVVEHLLDTFNLDRDDLYEVDGPINLTRLMAIYGSENRPDLKDPSFSPATPGALRGADTPEAFFGVISRDDILLHHPYDSFRPVTRFIEYAARDPHTLAIKVTLYRTSKDSPIVRALMQAAQSGKQVTALVELKARFDEENNIHWAQAMEDAGVHVVYGLVGLKTHSKLALVVRREDNAIRRYVHLGTGNYNEVTARIYTDIGMLTADAQIGEDAAKIFNLLTGMSQFPGLDKLMMAPFDLDKEFIARIEREAANARKSARSKTHKIPSRIIIKMNSLVDPGAIKALYRASQAGVRIDLIIRGICCLRPGVAGLSENIRVRSIIGRFLEHSRIFYFENGGTPEIFCGSADWMPRNFFRRIEVIYPVNSAGPRARIQMILEESLLDNAKAREVLPDGSSRRVVRAPNEAKRDVQADSLKRASERRAQSDAMDARQSVQPPGLAPLKLQTKPWLNRAVPVGISPVDGLPGTGDDPVLQSLQQSLQESGTPRAKDKEAEEFAETVEAGEAETD